MATTISGGAAGVNTASTTVGPAGITFGDSTVQTTAAGTPPVLNVYTNTAPGQVWTKPATVKAIKVTVVGGGGDGGSAQVATPAPNATSGSGGGGGGMAVRTYPAPSLPGPQPYTVGAPSGTSSFGAAPVTVVSATGGTVGNPGPSASPYLGVGVAGGAGTNGTLTIDGQRGGASSINSTSGSGGSSGFGLGGLGRNPNDGSGVGYAGTGYGAGAGGSFRASLGSLQPSTTGQSGVVIIEEFY